MTAPTLLDVDLPSTIPGASPALRGVLGIPAGTGPWPAIVMVHEAFGLDAVMRRQVERMTAAGFLTLMPDLYTAGSTRHRLTATFRAISAGHGRVFDDVETARRFLAARSDFGGGMGLIGFCMGGGFALVAASGHGFDAASVNYGVLPKDIESTLTGACPVVASYGRRDLTQRGSAITLERTLTKLDIPHDVKEYPAAGHAFLNEDEAGPAALRPIMKAIIGVGPEPGSAQDAWRRIDGFFREHLNAPAAADAGTRHGSDGPEAG